MTSKDKTGDQLVASIRTTKASVARKTTKTTKPARKPASKSAAAKSSPKKPAPRKPAHKPVGTGDPYQAGQRVWPD